MPDFSGLGATFYEAAGANAATSAGTTISDAGTNTKGSYTQLIASTTYPSSWIYVVLNKPSTADEFLVDLAVGASSSEQVIVSDLIVAAASVGASQGSSYLFPLSIPAGSRLSARCQSNSSGADSIDVTVHLISGTMISPAGMGIVTTYGANTGTTLGTNVDPGGTAHTKGAYVEFSSSTAYPINWLVIATVIDVSVAAEENFLLDIAVGGSGSEQVAIPNLYFRAPSTIDRPFPSAVALPVSIPAGSRISARCQCSVNTATERLLGLIMYGVS